MMIKGLLKLKSCLRCKGDVEVNRDMYGEYNSCLQCGWFLDVDKLLDIELDVKKTGGCRQKQRKKNA